MKTKTIKKLFRNIKLNGGFTVRNGKNFKGSGYCVSVELNPIKLHDFNFNAFELIVNHVIKSDCFGAWYDNETGITYIEPVLILNDIHQAKELGRLYNQIAIYDLSNGVEIRL